MENRKKQTIIEIAKIIGCACCVPLSFIKCFGSLLLGENPDGTLFSRKCYFSLAEEMEAMDVPIAIPLALLTLSIILSVVCLICKGKQPIRTIGHIVFAVSLVVFLGCFFFAQFVAR